jgi:hypothetical protein
MSRFTFQQKHAFLNVAHTHSRAVYEIISRGGPREIGVCSRDEAMVLDDFARKVPTLLTCAHPDYAGQDEGLIEDAETVVQMISTVLADYGFER